MKIHRGTLGVFLGLFGVLLLFALIYFMQPSNSYYSASRGDVATISFEEAWCLSVDSQTLLGHMDLVAIKSGARLTSMFQSLSTLLLVVFFASHLAPLAS